MFPPLCWWCAGWHQGWHQAIDNPPWELHWWNSLVDDEKLSQVKRRQGRGCLLRCFCRTEKLRTLSVRVGGHDISASTSMRNLGVLFNSSMSNENHISAICKTAYFHLYHISKNRKYLTNKSTHILVQAKVISWLDTHNSLLSGLSAAWILKL